LSLHGFLQIFRKPFGNLSPGARRGRRDFSRERNPSMGVCPMAISLRVEVPPSPQLEHLLKYLAGVKLPLWQKCSLVEDALRWLKLANSMEYPRPRPQSVQILIDGEVVVATQRSPNTGTPESPSQSSVSQVVEAQSA